MPTRKRTTKNTASKNTKSSKSNNNAFDFRKLINSADSYKSLIYGIITVIVLFVVIVLGVRALQKNKADIANNGMVTTLQQENKTPKNQYTVSDGETLWSIAQKEYGDGFQWTKIAEANHITDATTLEKGTKLTIPEIAKATSTPTVEIAQATITPSPTSAQNEQNPQQKITGDTYTVQHGDYLWEIAIRAYGDGYRWVDIAKANNLANPNLIFSGNVLKLPRP